MTGGVARITKVLVLVGAMACAPAAAQEVPIYPIDCVDVSCGEFTDLEPLDQRIEGKRIVYLGEATHGDGSSLKLKARLVRYLYEVHNYDVLVFESGLADLFAANELRKAGYPADESLRNALFPIWARTEQIGDLTEYLDKTEIEVAGFDIQLSGVRPQYLIMRLYNLGDQFDLDPDPFRRIASGIAVLRQQGWDGLVSLDAQQFHSDVEVAIRSLDSAAKPEADPWKMVLRNLSHAVDYFKSIPEGGLDETDFLNREKLMAENLYHLTETEFAGRKIIVWGATSHVMGDRQLLEAFVDDHFESAGEQHQRLRRNQAEDLRIAISAYSGSRGNIFKGDEVDIATAADNTLEAAAFAKIDEAPAALVLLNPEDEVISRALGHWPVSGAWGAAIDALFVVKEMEPTTLLD